MDEKSEVSLFYYIGLVTLTWAKLEGELDAINHAAFHFGEGDKVEGQVPQSLDRKLGFMRQTHKKLPELAPLRAAADVLIDRVHALKQRRHDLVHGIAMDAPIGDLLELRVLGRDKKGQRGLSLRTVSVTTADLKDLFDQIMDLVELAGDHFVAVCGAVFGKGDEDEGGNLPD